MRASLVCAVLLNANRITSAYDGPSGLLVDLLEKTDVVWRDGFPTQLTLDELPSAIERLQTVEIRSSRPSFSWIVPSPEKTRCKARTKFNLQRR